MTNEETYKYCDVIGCRKPAAVEQTEALSANEEWLCEACYRHIKLSRPDLASCYKQICIANTEIDALSCSTIY